MKFVKYWKAICLLAVILMGCTPKHDHKGKTPLVEAAGEYLYEEDLRAALPLNLSKDDSILFAESYIKNWVEEVLLFDKAEGNIPDNDRVAKLVESYRRALIMHTYQEELVNQRLANDIDTAEIAAYYAKNRDLFRMETPYVKGLFIKVPLKASGIGNVRNWYKRNDQMTIEKLEKYSLGSAVGYDYFYDRWTPVADVAAKIPLKALGTEGDYLDKNRNIEVKDTAFCYFLHVEEYLGRGEHRPLDFARDEIKEILINLKRVEFINGVKDELYREASDRNKINYFYLNKEDEQE